jgi:hypothetical protein
MTSLLTGDGTTCTVLRLNVRFNEYANNPTALGAVASDNGVGDTQKLLCQVYIL